MNQNKITLSAIFLILALSLCFSCKKSSDVTNSPSKTHDVFIAGNSIGKKANSIATYWKNGKAVLLGKDVEDYYTVANALFVADSDVYVAGYSPDSRDLYEAAYWKNESLHILTTTNSFLDGIGYSIYVSGKDVYVAGFGPYLSTTAATYWKNNQYTTLSDAGGSTANSIYIAGNDIYIAGEEPIGGTDVQAVFWKNRKKNILATKYPDFSSHASSIVVSGNDVYIAGDEFDDDDGNIRSYATIWKNGIPTHIGLQDSNTIKGLFISGNDVFAAGSSAHGRTYSAAAYWENGVRTFVTPANISQANSIYVIDNDVYTAGFIENEAVYWKNDELNYLDKGIIANAIYVR